MKYLHVGSGKMLPLSDLIGIINLESETAAAGIVDLREQAEADGRMFSAAGEKEPRSLIITGKGLYWSAIAAATLYKRAMGYEEDER